MKRVTFWLVLALPAMLGACNTVKGFGEDLSAAGHALSSSAEYVMGSEPATPAAPTAVEGSSGAPLPAAGSTPRPLSAPPPEEPK